VARALQVHFEKFGLHHEQQNGSGRTSQQQLFSDHRQQLQQDEVNQSAVSEALQKRMENVVLSMQSGSHSQRVQAEFLKEVESNMQRALKSST
jgi:hypothetical protein